MDRAPARRRCRPSSYDLATVTPKRRLVEEHTLGIRSTVGSMLESSIGRERTNTIRRAERRARNALAKGLAVEEPQKSNKKPSKQPGTKPATSSVRKPAASARPSRWQPPDPFASHPEPTMTRHELLEVLHEEDAASDVSGNRYQNGQQPGDLACSLHRRGSVLQDRQADSL